MHVGTLISVPVKLHYFFPSTGELFRPELWESGESSLRIILLEGDPTRSLTFLVITSTPTNDGQ